MRIVSTLLLLLGSYSIGVAQWIYKPVSASYFNFFYLSGNHTDVLSTSENPASLASMQQHAVGVYGENRFMVKGLNMFRAAGVLATGTGSFGLNLGYFGSPEQNQLAGSVGYGRNIAQKFHVGASFHYLQLSQSNGYGGAGSITGSVGFAAELPGNVRIGLSAFNPFRAKWGKSATDHVPASYALGAGMDVSKKAFVGINLVKEESRPVDVQLGFHYQMIEPLFVRIGAATQTGSYFGALGWKASSFRVDVATSYHPTLGWTPGVALIAALGNRQDNP